MTELGEESLQVRLAVDDARSAQAAGATFARTLAGASTDAFALALAEQERPVQHAVTDAGYTVLQADRTARSFAAAAAAEWRRIVDAGGSEAWGTA